VIPLGGRLPERKPPSSNKKAAGTPEDVVKVKESYMAQYLNTVLARRPKAVGQKQEAE